MADTMPRTRPLHLHRFVTRHGKIIWYYRKRGQKAVQIKGVYGSPEFMAAYQAASSGKSPAPKEANNRAPYSLAWCIKEFMKSPQWLEYAKETHKQMGYQFERMEKNAGDRMIYSFTNQDILASRFDRRAKPSDANKYVRAARMLFSYCLSQEWVDSNPALGIPKYKTSKSGSGFYSWTREDFAKFEARWKVGTSERLAYEIIVGTGLRRGDAHTFGKLHIRDKNYIVRTKKTGMMVESAMPPKLLAAISATKTGETSFLLSSRGTPFKSKQSFGIWFSDACKLAGIPGSAHGIRKGIAAIAAEEGMTEAQMNAFFGWSHHSKESAVYIEAANRSKMAKPVGEVIAQTRAPGLRKKRARH